MQERIAGGAGDPRPEAFRIGLVGPQGVVGPGEVLVLDARLVLELLDEVIAPREPGDERGERAPPARVRAVLVELGPPAPCGLPRLSAGDRPEGEVRTEPGAGVEGGQGRRHRAAVVHAALVQERPQGLVRRPLAAAGIVHAGRAAREAERRRVGRRQRPVVRPPVPGCGGVQPRRRHPQRGRHARLPLRGPAIPRREPPHDAVARSLVYGNPPRLRPRAHAAIARVREGVARLLVRPQRREG
jgi:hypothetical protein